MFRFTIRDVLWLMVVVGLVLGWWVWRQSILPLGEPVDGIVSISNGPLADGRVCFHAADGQIVGSRVRNGWFHIRRVPAGTFSVTIDGKGVPAKYSDEQSELTVKLIGTATELHFDLQ